MTIAAPSNPAFILDDGAFTYAPAGGGTFTRKGMVGGEERVVDSGSSVAPRTFLMALEISVLKTTAGNEQYDLTVEGCGAADFSGEVRGLASWPISMIGQQDIIGISTLDPLDDTIWRYLRMSIQVSGTLPAIRIQPYDATNPDNVESGAFLRSLSNLAEFTDAELLQIQVFTLQNLQNAMACWLPWATGEVGGGPNNDGRYPIYDGFGHSVLVKCPAQQDADTAAVSLPSRELMPGRYLPPALQHARVSEVDTGSGIGGAYYKRVAADPDYDAASFRSADRFLPDGTVDSADGGWWRLNETFIDITRLGCRPGHDVARKINEAFLNEAPGTRFWIPGANKEEPWFVEEPIVMPSGGMLEGFGWTLDIAGAVLMRPPSATYRMIEWIGDPTKPEHHPFRYINNAGLRNIYINGGKADHEIMGMAYVGVCEIDRCVFSHDGSRSVFKPLIRVFGQTQDSWVSRSYFYNGGSFDGTVAAVEIDDSHATAIGHNQHLRFNQCTWEAFNGRALKLSGFGAEAPIGNTVMVFDNCKFEAVTRSRVAYLEFENARSIVINNASVLSKGPDRAIFPEQYPIGDETYVIPELVSFKNCSRIRFSATMLKQPPEYVTLDHLITLQNVQDIDIDIKMADAPTCNNLNDDHIVHTDGLTKVVVRLSYRGDKKPCNFEVPFVLDQQRMSVTHTSALAGEFARLDPATNEIINGNRAFKFTGANPDGSEDMYFGVNAAGEFCVSLTADLSNYKFKVDRAGQPFTKSNTINMLVDGNPILITSGVGSPEGVKAAHVGSLYLRVDGYAAHTLYVKETGATTVDTGWVAK